MYSGVSACRSSSRSQSSIPQIHGKLTSVYVLTRQRRAKPPAEDITLLSRHETRTPIRNTSQQVQNADTESFLLYTKPFRALLVAALEITEQDHWIDEDAHSPKRSLSSLIDSNRITRNYQSIPKTVAQSEAGKHCSLRRIDDGGTVQR